ncbi:MAG: hypothetical protein ACE5RA_06605 [Nitrosopumilus sp.]|jgi:Tfp pilus assembly protein PilZ
MDKNNLPTNFLSYLQNGNLKISTDDKPSIDFSVSGNLKVINIIDLPIKIRRKQGIIKKLSEAKELAKNMNNRGMTLEIQLQGKTVLKIGKEANPKLAKIVTLSSHIEITDLKKLKKLSETF